MTDELLDNVQLGYDSNTPPCDLNSHTVNDEAKMLGYILAKNGKPMPQDITFENSIWHINDDTKAVMTPPKNNKPGAVYINGDKRPRILRDDT